MDFSFSDEQLEVRSLAGKILGDFTSQERLRSVEAGEEGIDRELWAALAKADLLGCALPAAHGGGELGFTTLCLLLEEVGRAVAPVPALACLALGALPLAEFGTDEQQRRWLPGVVSGAHLLTAALSETGVDSAKHPATVARRHGDDWTLEGVKQCVPCAHLAERILVPATTSPSEVAVFLVDPTQPGVTLERQQTTDRQPHSRLTLAGARVSAAERLGGGKAAQGIADWIAERATAAYCMLQLGVSERALQMTAEYIASRKQFDRPVGSFQAVHTRAADAHIDVEAIRLTAWQAVWALEAGRPAADAVAVAKFWAADGGQTVGYAAQHLHGGIGIDVDYPLHRYYLWAKQIELTLGSAADQLERIGDAMAEAD